MNDPRREKRVGKMVQRTIGLGLNCQNPAGHKCYYERYGALPVLFLFHVKVFPGGKDKRETELPVPAILLWSS